MDVLHRGESTGRKALSVVSAAALGIMLVPIAGGAAGGSVNQAEAAVSDMGSTALTAKATVPKSGSRVVLEAGDQATLTLKGFKIKKASSSKKKVVTAKKSASKLKLAAKKAGTATVTAKKGSKTFKVKVTVKKEGTLTLVKGKSKTFSLSKLSSVSSSKKSVLKVKKAGNKKFTVTAKKAGAATIAAKTKNGTRSLYLMSAKGSVSADSAIESVKSYATVDIDGAKTQAIVIEYDQAIDAKSVSLGDYQITDYTTYLAANPDTDKDGNAQGFLERGEASTAGTAQRVYVNNEPATAAKGKASGKYVIVEVNTDYMLSGNVPKYTSTLMVGAKQVGKVASAKNVITKSSREVGNYTAQKQEKTNREGEVEGMTSVITTEPDSYILPQFGEGSGWTVGKKLEVKNAYSEYTGENSDYTQVYSEYVPKLTDADKGKVALALHILDAGSLGSDPYLTLTESQGPADWSSDYVQGKQKTIVLAVAVPEEQRSSDDYVATSEVNSGMWQLLDSTIAEYKDYIDTDRIYGTGQSMGGMTLMDMAAQRDNFFAGFMIFGSQWSNGYNKAYQHAKEYTGLEQDKTWARSAANDPTTFTGSYADDPNVNNWYYQISDDNVLVMNCTNDQMSYGLWNYTQKYFSNVTGTAYDSSTGAGVIAHKTWNPNEPIATQDAAIEQLVNHSTSKPGEGINWGSFEGGDHMSTWKYGYAVNAGWDWLLQQTRTSEVNRGKLETLNNDFTGLDENGNLKSGSGTKNMNSAQFSPFGSDPAYSEGWTPESVEKYNAEHPSEGRR